MGGKMTSAAPPALPTKVIRASAVAIRAKFKLSMRSPVVYDVRYERPWGKYKCRFMDVTHTVSRGDAHGIDNAKWNVDVYLDNDSSVWEVLLDQYFNDENEALKFWNQLDKHIFVALSRL